MGYTIEHNMQFLGYPKGTPQELIDADESIFADNEEDTYFHYDGSADVDDHIKETCSKYKAAIFEYTFRGEDSLIGSCILIQGDTWQEVEEGEDPVMDGWKLVNLNDPTPEQRIAYCQQQIEKHQAQLLHWQE